MRLQLGEELQHLGAHGDVERRDRLVGDDEFRPAHDGAGDRDALALAAGELVRIALGETVAEADLAPAPPARARLLRPRAMSGTSRSASPTRSPIVMRGSSEEYGSWNTIWQFSR